MAARHDRPAGLRAFSPSLRGAALMPFCALAVHQLRYELAYGARAGQELAAQGHAYLSSWEPWLMLLALLAVGGSLGGLGRRWAHGPQARGTVSRPSGLRLWAVAVLALVTVYVAQELLEGLVADGHPPGLAGVFGDGGLWALPSAALVGALLAGGLRCAEAAFAQLAAPVRWQIAAAGGGTRAGSAPVAPFLAPPTPLARRAAGRAPPRMVSTSFD